MSGPTQAQTGCLLVTLRFVMQCFLIICLYYLRLLFFATLLNFPLLLPLVLCLYLYSLMIRPESVFTTVELMNWFHLPSRLLKMISELWLKVRVQRGPAECFCNSKPMETSATPQQTGLFHLILNPFQKAIFSLAFDTQWYINFAVFKILCHFKNLVSSHLLDHFIPLMVTGRLHTWFKNLLTIFVLLSRVIYSVRHYVTLRDVWNVLYKWNGLDVQNDQVYMLWLPHI